MKAFQLKIAIKNSKPPIWRRVIVPAGITFSQLSMILNEVMGWCGYHMFEFEFYHLELRIMEGVEDYLQDYYYDYQEASETYIREYLEENDWFTYVYDLGDYWAHRVTIEKIIDNYEFDYPQVVKYKGDCPVEDCGGIDGYYDCLDIISDENHPEYEERLAWMKLQGYPHEYDMEYVNEELKTRYFYKWGKGEKRIQEELYMEQFSGVCGLNATKKDKNKKNNVHTSKKHSMEDSLQTFADFWKRWNNTIDNMPYIRYETTLNDIFSDFTKDNIMEIAKEKGVKGISNCNKEKLIDKLTEYMLQPDVMKSYFVCLQDEEIAEFEKAARGNGSYTPKTSVLLSKLYESAYIGVLPDGSVDVPLDVRVLYKAINTVAFSEERKKYSYVMCCLQTVTILYGIVPMDVFMQLINKNTEIHISEDEIRDILECIPPEFAQHILVGNQIYHKELYPDDKGLLAVQGSKEYYIPTYKEIIDLGKLGYLPDNATLKKLERFLTNQLGEMDDDAEFAVKIIQMMICADCKIQEVYEVLEELDIIVETDKQMNQLVRYVNEMWNDTRMLLNRGYTPNEIANKEMKNHVAPLVKNNTSNVISFDKVKQSKVYPNDPCPCGSGKKYKNCCKGK